MFEAGIPEDRVETILNFVDLRRYLPRSPLPAQPWRALVFSNYASERTHLPVVREACARAGLTLDVVGISSGNPTARPEAILGQYDVVFAKARAALEAMAIGAAVVLCDATGVGPMVTSPDLDRLRPLNFGFRTLTAPLEVDAVLAQLRRYDPSDAAEVSRRIRSMAGLEDAVDRILAVYEAVAGEHRAAATSGTPGDADRAIAAYLSWLNPYVKQGISALRERDALRQQSEALERQWSRRIARRIWTSFVGIFERPAVK